MGGLLDAFFIGVGGHLLQPVGDCGKEDWAFVTAVGVEGGSKLAHRGDGERETQVLGCEDLTYSGRALSAQEVAEEQVQCVHFDGFLVLSKVGGQPRDVGKVEPFTTNERGGTNAVGVNEHEEDPLPGVDGRVAILVRPDLLGRQLSGGLHLRGDGVGGSGGGFVGVLTVHCLKSCKFTIKSDKY